MKAALASPQTFPAQPDEDGRPAVGRWAQLSFNVVHGCVAVLLRVLTIRGLYLFARGFGTLEWLINYKRRRRFGVALARVLESPPTNAERRRATREHFCQSRCDKLFYLVMDCIPREQAVSLFSIENQHLLDDALARGRGVYVALSHNGPHHTAGNLFALTGYKITGVRDRREGGIRRFVQDRLDRKYPEFRRMQLLFADSFPRDIYRCFQEGYVLASAIDVSPKRSATLRAVEVDTPAGKRSFLTGPLHIAIRCGAPVIQGFAVPYPWFRYGLKLVEVLIDPDDVGERGEIDDAVKRAVEKYAANLERHIRNAPTLITRV